MTYSIIARFDSSDSTTLIIKQEGVQGYWTLWSTSDGQDWLVNPFGSYTDGTMIDSRDDTAAGRLYAWLGDQDF